MGLASCQAPTPSLPEQPTEQTSQASAGTSYSYDYRAPDLHCIRGEWYIYVAADNGQLYFIWSSRETFEWPDVNEGQTALVCGDDVFIVYSASGSWSDHYCLGMLTLTGDDLLNPDHWEKSTEPVFDKKDGLA